MDSFFSSKHNMQAVLRPLYAGTLLQNGIYIRGMASIIFTFET